MNIKSREERVQILRCLVEGASIRSTARITGSSPNTIMTLLKNVGYACSVYQDVYLRNLKCKYIQVDEVWSFVGSKAKNTPEEKKDVAGTVWLWTSLCPDTKLVPTWHLGTREADTAALFINDVASRMSGRITLASDGYRVYIDAVEDAFGDDVDYGQVVKNYKNDPQADKTKIGIFKERVTGNPDPKLISTSLIERQNLTVRMGNRRFTRKTNAFSKKIENHSHAMALHYMYYNFVRIHQTTRVTPAMAAGVSNKLWELGDIVDLLEWKFKIR